MHDRCDIAMISNIPEWAKSDIQMTNLSNNLYSLLRKNGIVLCSRFHEFPERAEKERRIFEANFEFHDYGKNVGYCYIKK